MSAKSRLRKALVLRGRVLRRKVEKADLLRPRNPRRRPKIEVKRTYPWGTSESIVASWEAHRAKVAARPRRRV
jgi:hypothetical protein